MCEQDIGSYLNMDKVYVYMLPVVIKCNESRFDHLSKKKLYIYYIYWTILDTE